MCLWRQAEHTADGVWSLPPEKVRDAKQFASCQEGSECCRSVTVSLWKCTVIGQLLVLVLPLVHLGSCQSPAVVVIHHLRVHIKEHGHVHHLTRPQALLLKTEALDLVEVVGCLVRDDVVGRYTSDVVVAATAVHVSNRLSDGRSPIMPFTNDSMCAAVSIIYKTYHSQQRRVEVLSACP